MRILILHSRYLSGPASGENQVVTDEARLLRENGHRVETWSPEPLGLTGSALVKTALGAVWSLPAVRHVRGLLRSFLPDVIHIHNLFPTLSPAVIRAASQAAPVVMTLHNYRFMCLPSTLLRRGRLCETCVRRPIAWPGILHRCYHGSTVGSAVLATSLGMHRMLRTFDRVSLYLAVSRFIRDKHVEAGLPSSKILVKSNFAWNMSRREGPGRYFLYLGRLSPEKGVVTLLEAWRGVRERLLVVGDGPEASRLREIAPPTVEFRHTVPAAAVPSLLVGARALCLPSIWYEGQPRSILEAYAAGVPVLASRIGGLPDVVENEVSGLLLPPGDRGAWVEATERLSNNAETLRLGQGAWHLWRNQYSPRRALEALERAYRIVASGGSSAQPISEGTSPPGEPRDKEAL